MPTIHDNGTGAGRLCKGYETAWNALQTAYAATKATAPNPRDYGPGELGQAENEHDMRLARLSGVMDELEKLIGYCAPK